MGTDTHVWLPPQIDVEDALEVAARALNTPGKWAHSPMFADVVDLMFEASSIAPTFHFTGHEQWLEGDEWVQARRGWHLISMASTPTRAALAVKLVDALGGYVDFDDCDDTTKDHVVRPPACFSRWTDSAYTAKRRRLEAVTKITAADIDAVRSRTSASSDDEEARLR